MGLSASQGRLEMLVARKSDLEFRGQMINQRRILLAYQTEESAKKYSDAISNTMIKITLKDNQSVNITQAHAATIGWQIKDALGAAITDANYDSEAITKGLKDGTLKLVYTAATDGHAAGSEVDWRSMSTVDDNLYTVDDAAATALYEAESTHLQTQDKKLEMELKNVDTQHSAVQTEMDAVKKVIDKNIESSFKTFA